MAYNEDSSEKYNMRIFAEDGTDRKRDEFSVPDYPVNIYRINMNKLRTSVIHWHWHNEMEIIYVIDGHINFMTHNISYECSTGEAVIVNGNVMHNINVDQESSGSFFSIIYSPEFIVGHEGGILWMKYWIPFQNTEFQAMRLSRDVNWKSRMLDDIETAVTAGSSQKQGYELVVKGALCSCMAEIASQLTPPESKTEKKIETVDEYRVKTAITFIKHHYAENISLSDIADSTNVSKSECCRYFQRTLHITPFEYLMRYRVYTAASKLCDVSGPVTSMSGLAMNVGFNSISYFNKLFRKYMLCTPTQYRYDMIDREGRDGLEHVDFTF